MAWHMKTIKNRKTYFEMKLIPCGQCGNENLLNCII